MRSNAQGLCRTAVVGSTIQSLHQPGKLVDRCLRSANEHRLPRWVELKFQRSTCLLKLQQVDLSQTVLPNFQTPVKKRQQLLLQQLDLTRTDLQQVAAERVRTGRRRVGSGCLGNSRETVQSCWRGRCDNSGRGLHGSRALCFQLPFNLLLDVRRREHKQLAGAWVSRHANFLPLLIQMPQLPDNMVLFRRWTGVRLHDRGSGFGRRILLRQIGRLKHVLDNALCLRRAAQQEPIQTRVTYQVRRRIDGQ